MIGSLLTVIGLIFLQPNFPFLGSVGRGGKDLLIRLFSRSTFSFFLFLFLSFLCYFFNSETTLNFFLRSGVCINSRRKITSVAYFLLLQVSAMSQIPIPVILASGPYSKILTTNIYLFIYIIFMYSCTDYSIKHIKYKILKKIKQIEIKILIPHSSGSFCVSPGQQVYTPFLETTD